MKVKRSLKRSIHSDPQTGYVSLWWFNYLHSKLIYYSSLNKNAFDHALLLAKLVINPPEQLKCLPNFIQRETFSFIQQHLTNSFVRTKLVFAIIMSLVTYISFKRSQCFCLGILQFCYISFDECEKIQKKNSTLLDIWTHKNEFKLLRILKCIQLVCCVIAFTAFHARR